MEKIILPNKSVINVSRDIQTGTKGDRFMLSGISKNIEKPDMRVNKILKSYWIYEFRYLDKSGGFNIEIDYFDNFVCLSKKI